ncbi:MAG TPA: PP2C family protein-serine/threonine phosphatase [Bacteroidota bacterium]|nr:PP2C family protein-serine/threonine phosphatase [Bacteroidota bacterium]
MMSRFKRLLLIAVPPVLFLLVFAYDIIRATVNLEIAWLDFAREGIILIAFGLIYLLVVNNRATLKRVATKDIGRLLIVCAVVLSFVGFLSAFGFVNSGNQDSEQTRYSVMNIFLSMILAVCLGVVSIRALLTIKDLVLFKRKKGTKRNYTLYLIFLFGSTIVMLPLLSIEGALLGTLFFTLCVLTIVANSFRQSWIVYLSRKEKMYIIIYSAFLFIAFVLLNVLFFEKTFTNKALLAFSQPLYKFSQLNAIFGAVYFGMAFVSTLFHLPTAEVFERKQFEITSLHNLSRLVTQVFDFNDLVNTVTQMTLEVCGAKSAWLELISREGQKSALTVEVVSARNITNDRIEAIATGELRNLIIESRKYLLIDDVSTDRRTRHVKEQKLLKGSLLSIPLISHENLIGTLYAIKELEYGFDQDDIDVLTTFADNVTIAIENSKLIARSLERERLQQEMMVARTMQKRLLPQSLPTSDRLDIVAISESSLEVGGDYYDCVELSKDRLGIVVGDVSGKGVSAAFYMAEVKGIFLSLSKVCASPKDLLVRANETLLGSLEKKAFISLIYAILDTKNGSLHIARAGHCPLVYVSDGRVEQVRPSGLGLGLAGGEIFDRSTEERLIILKKGDVCIFYTDGITESRDRYGEEFGYDRLASAAQRLKERSADDIKEGILQDVRNHIGELTYGDDMTLVIIKWLGKQGVHS